MMKRSEFVFGIKEFDERFKHSLKQGTMIAIVGFPGTGKTTFAATVCYVNAKRGNPCTYISTQEPREKFYEVMKKFGMNFEVLEAKGLFKFISLPLLSTIAFKQDVFISTNESLIFPTSLETAKIFMEALEALIHENKVRVVVIDSVSPLLRIFSKTLEGRAYLQNYLYNLARMINGLLILTVEYSYSPILKDIITDVEYVADIVIEMSQKNVRGLLERSMRILKIRGSPIISSEIPFDIKERKGIVAFLPPLIEEIHISKETLKWPCKVFEKLLYNIPKNHTLYVGYNAKTSFKMFLSILASLMKVNDLKKGLIINYSYPPEFFNNLLVKSLTSLGIDGEKARKIIKELFIIETINPLTMSLYEVFSTEISIIEHYKPDVVVFWDVQVPMLLHATKDISKYITVLKNQILILKRYGILTIRLGRFTTTERLDMNLEVSDLVFKRYHDVVNPKNSYVIIEGPFIDATKIPECKLNECVKESLSVLVK